LLAGVFLGGFQCPLIRLPDSIDIFFNVLHDVPIAFRMAASGFPMAVIAFGVVLIVFRIVVFAGRGLAGDPGLDPGRISPVQPGPARPSSRMSPIRLDNASMIS